MKAKDIATQDNALPQAWWQESGLGPDKKLAHATEYANALKDLVDKNKLTKRINGKDYVFCEGWTALGGLLGVFANTDFCRKREDDKEFITYDARVYLQTTDGRIIASAESMCSSKERNWKTRDEFAIKSMAQTRATAKACRLAFSWIMVLAGYAPTPAEEMDNNGEEPPKKNTDDAPATQKQINLIKKAVLKSHLIHAFEQYLIEKKIAANITKTDASHVLDWWIGDDGEQKKREEKEQADLPELQEYLVKVEKSLQEKHPEEYKEFLQSITK